MRVRGGRSDPARPGRRAHGERGSDEPSGGEGVRAAGAGPCGGSRGRSRRCRARRRHRRRGRGSRRCPADAGRLVDATTADDAVDRDPQPWSSDATRIVPVSEIAEGCSSIDVMRCGVPRKVTVSPTWTSWEGTVTITTPPPPPWRPHGRLRLRSFCEEPGDLGLSEEAGAGRTGELVRRGQMPSFAGRGGGDVVDGDPVRSATSAVVSRSVMGMSNIGYAQPVPMSRLCSNFRVRPGRYRGGDGVVPTRPADP